MDSSAQNMSRSEDLKLCPLSACSSYTKRHTHNHRQLSDTLSNTFKDYSSGSTKKSQAMGNAHQLHNSLTLTVDSHCRKVI